MLRLSILLVFSLTSLEYVNAQGYVYTDEYEDRSKDFGNVWVQMPDTGKQYYFITEALTYQQAIAKCSSLSTKTLISQLTSVPGYNNENFIRGEIQKGYLATGGTFGNNGVWSGGKYVGVIDLFIITKNVTNWAWPDLSTVSYKDWAPEQPKTPFKDTCIMWSSNSNFLWENKACSASLQAVCESR